VVPRRRVAAADAGGDLRLQRVVLRLELGLAGPDALDNRLLLRLDVGDLLPLAVGFGAELCSVVSLTGGGVLRLLGLRLFLPEIVLGVVELVLEAALALELALELARVLTQVLAARDDLVGAALRGEQRQRARGGAVALVQRERRRVEAVLRRLDLRLDLVDVPLNRVDLGLDACDLGLRGLDLLRRVGDLTVELGDFGLEFLPLGLDTLELLDRRDFLGRCAVDGLGELAPAVRVRLRLCDCGRGRDRAQYERGREETEKDPAGDQRPVRLGNTTHRNNS